MISKTKAIVLSKIKYSDYDLIVKCYSENYGVIKFLLKGVLRNKKGKLKAAYFQNLSQLQLEVSVKPNRDLQYVKEVKPHVIYTTLQTDIIKSTIAMFLAEILSNVLHEEESNESLYSFLETTLQWLDTGHEHVNFHLLFLLKLTKYLGFYPDIQESYKPYFNLRAGKFEDQPSDLYSISGENLVLLKQLLGTGFDALSSIKINSTQRQFLLNQILSYFELHLDSFKKPKSLEVFHQVFTN